MKINREQINSIAQNPDTGKIVSLNLKTSELLSVIDPDNLYSDPKLHRDDIDKLRKTGMIILLGSNTLNS